MDNQIINQEPIVETPINQEPINQEPVTQEPIAETPVIAETPTAEPTLRDFGIVPKPPQNNIFKIIFIFSLIIFILTASAFAFVYYQSQKKSSPTDNSPSTISSTPAPSGTCFLNDKTYQAGESFASADGCNTCSCQSQDMIVCTEKACLSTDSATQSGTQDWQTYTSKNEYVDYNFIYPKTWKLLEISMNLIQIEGDTNSDYNNKVENGVSVCKYYYILCYKDPEFYETPTTISNYIDSKKQQFKEVQKTTINNQTAYSLYTAGTVPEIKKYLIERKDGAFCEISFCDKDLTANENRFVNSFKFN